MQRELELAAVVARYHRGALPRPQAQALQALDLPDRRMAVQAAGILRLAKALDIPASRSRGAAEKAPRLEVGMAEHAIMLRLESYSALERSAERMASSRHLLETVLRRPILVQALRAVASRRGRATPGRPSAKGSAKIFCAGCHLQEYRYWFIRTSPPEVCVC